MTEPLNVRAIGESALFSRKPEQKPAHNPSDTCPRKLLCFLRLPAFGYVRMYPDILHLCHLKIRVEFMASGARCVGTHF